MTLKVAINGFGRIGRNTLRALYESGRSDIEIVAINDLSAPEVNAHLLEFDSVHGRFSKPVSVDGDTLRVDGDAIRVTAERNPADLPWSDVDIVFECTEPRADLGPGKGHAAGENDCLWCEPRHADRR